MKRGMLPGQTPLIAVCCKCGLVREEAGASPDQERWVTKRTYRETHDVNPTDFPLTHAYCLKCLTEVQNTVRQYFRQF